MKVSVDRIWTSTLLCVLLTLVGSCSTMTKNTYMTGEVVLVGGQYQDKTWDESLVLKRSSWFKELTMYFDVLYAHIDKESPFYRWFSEDEKLSLEECVDIIITSSYAFRPRDISKSMFKLEMAKYGYEAFALNGFERNLRMHPDFARYQMGVYSTHAFCRRGMSSKKMAIQFPGFKEVYLN